MLPLEFTFNHLSQNCCWLNSTSIVEFAHSQQNKCFMVLPTSQARTFKEFEQVAEARCFQILLTILWWKGPQFRHVSKTPKTFLRTGWNWKLSVQSLGIMIPTKNFGRVSQMFVIFRPYCIRTYLSIIVYSPPRIQLLTEKDALGQLGWLANPESLIFFSLLLLSCQVSGRYEETKHCAEWGGGGSCGFVSVYWYIWYIRDPNIYSDTEARLKQKKVSLNLLPEELIKTKFWMSPGDTWHILSNFFVKK